MIIAVNVIGDNVGEGLGRAQTMAVANVENGQIESWQTYDVRWDLTHDLPSGHGAQHTRITGFMTEHDVDAVVAGHVGPPMVAVLSQMRIGVLQEAEGDARQAVLDAAAILAEGRDAS